MLKLLDYAAQLFPVRFVRPWERGLYLIAGRYWKTVRPGPQFVIPGLCEVLKVSIVPDEYQTNAQTITLRDGSTLGFTASITVVVTDPAKAYLELGHYTETVVERAAAILAEGLADADPARFDPSHGKRGRLREELRGAINKNVSAYGLEVTELRLNNFIRGVRTIRLLLDRAVLGALPTPPG